MKNQTKLVIWVILSIIMLAIVGVLVCNIVIAKTKTIKNPIATFELENYGTVKFELYPEYAPNTVSNFVYLINKGFYNGKTLYGKSKNSIYAEKTTEGETVEPTYKLVDDSIEAGSTADEAYSINGEFVANDNFDRNILKHEKGVISMLREEYSSYFGLTEEGYNSASSHFQIMMDTDRSLNGLYAAFGKVIEGMEVLEAIYNSEVVVAESEEDTATDDTVSDFVTPAIITSATVDTFGIDYGIPEVQNQFDYDAFLQNYFNSYMNSTAE